MTQMMSNQLYDAAKWVAQILLPAMATLYFGLALVWGLPRAEEVVGTIVAIDLFLGTLLGISSSQYNKSDERFDGEMNIEAGVEKDVVTLELNDDPSSVLSRKNEVVFKVNRPPNH